MNRFPSGLAGMLLAFGLGLSPAQAGQQCSLEFLQKPPNSTRLPLRNGEYLDVRYIERLQATLSPLKAGEGVEYPFAYIWPDGSGAIGDWHSAGIGFRVEPSGTYILEYPEAAACSIKIQDPSRFTITVSTERKPYSFMHVGSLDDWAARLLFVGTYQDDRGRVYSFGESGKLQSPDGAKTYALHDDEEGFYHGLVWIDGRAYRFQRGRTRLTLRPVADTGEEIHDEPVISLRVLQGRGP